LRPRGVDPTLAKAATTRIDDIISPLTRCVPAAVSRARASWRFGEVCHLVESRELGLHLVRSSGAQQRSRSAGADRAAFPPRIAAMAGLGSLVGDVKSALVVA
jgi:hypothetical protein